MLQTRSGLAHRSDPLHRSTYDRGNTLVRVRDARVAARHGTQSIEL